MIFPRQPKWYRRIIAGRIAIPGPATTATDSIELLQDQNPLNNGRFMMPSQRTAGTPNQIQQLARNLFPALWATIGAAVASQVI